MEPMTIIWCRQCQRGYPSLDSVLTETELTVRQECRTAHGADFLRPIADSFISDKPNIELVLTVYFYAIDQNGKIWVVKKWRESINESFRYEVFEGKIKTEISTLSVQKADVAKQLRADAKDAGLEITDNQIELLICYLENQLKFDRFQERLKPKDVFVSDEHPLKIVVPLLDWLADSLYEFCQKFFPDKEFIKDFIGREKGRDGVLAFVGRRQFEVIHY